MTRRRLFSLAACLFFAASTCVAQGPELSHVDVEHLRGRHVDDGLIGLDTKGAGAHLSVEMANGWYFTAEGRTISAGPLEFEQYGAFGVSFESRQRQAGFGYFQPLGEWVGFDIMAGASREHTVFNLAGDLADESHADEGRGRFVGFGLRGMLFDRLEWNAAMVRRRVEHDVDREGETFDQVESRSDLHGTLLLRVAGPLWLLAGWQALGDEELYRAGLRATF